MGPLSPHGQCVLAPLLYSVYTADIPTHNPTLLATHLLTIRVASPLMIIISHNHPDHLRNIETWCRRWHVKVNRAKNVHLTFALHCQPSFPSPLIQFIFFLLIIFPFWDYLDNRLKSPYAIKKHPSKGGFVLLRRLLNKS